MLDFKVLKKKLWFASVNGFLQHNNIKLPIVYSKFVLWNGRWVGGKQWLLAAGRGQS